MGLFKSNGREKHTNTLHQHCGVHVLREVWEGKSNTATENQYLSIHGRSHKQIWSLLQHLDTCHRFSYTECLIGLFTVLEIDSLFFRFFKGIQQSLLDCYLSLTRAGWESEEECVTVIYRSLVSYSQGLDLVLSDVPWYFSFILISSGSWQLYGWWIKISFFKKCQSKKYARVAFPVQTQCWKGSKICLEDVSAFPMKVSNQCFFYTLPSNILGWHFCEWSNESAFSYIRLLNYLVDTCSSHTLGNISSSFGHKIRNVHFHLSSLPPGFWECRNEIQQISSQQYNSNTFDA